jgi:hypothetical protein
MDRDAQDDSRVCFILCFLLILLIHVKAFPRSPVASLEWVRWRRPARSGRGLHGAATTRVFGPKTPFHLTESYTFLQFRATAHFVNLLRFGAGAKLVVAIFRRAPSGVHDPRFAPAPSPGIPGEGWGEGDFEHKWALQLTMNLLPFLERFFTFQITLHPSPLPAYRERGRRAATDVHPAIGAV